ncbi:hypothetical protein [Janthinobacterium sp. B9-8]|uniref:hypothetical protein n=1 Tax=Janthinobacterium sp. B9-8 TaxID=1236179 RepID=UPI00061CF607|nr:hypothetical protein [Janthinobacterium sp. B9-8]AMC34309.1 hypothetical protein VN23_06700 [Janthinobacterium sp. B9-8]
MDASKFTQKFIDLEWLLLNEGTRLDAELLDKLIDDEFQEFGASGLSSIWRQSQNEWRMVFHQGTRTDAFEKP